VPRAISISQVTILDDVILIGDLVAKATAELYTAVFRCRLGRRLRVAVEAPALGGIRCPLDQLDVVLWLVDLCRNRLRAHQVSREGHIDGRVTVTLAKCAG